MIPESRKTVARYRWMVIAASLICLFSSLGASQFWDQDEGFFASTAAEMHQRGDLIVPWFNGELFGHKPPWMYWMMMTGFELFGVNEFGARFFSAVFGLMTAVLVFQFGTKMFNARVGLVAGLVMSSCMMFSVVSRAATPDSFLVFFSTLAMVWFASAGMLNPKNSANASHASESSTNVKSFLPSWKGWVAIYAMMGLAALVKGPIGFLFPMAVIGLFLLIMTPLRSVDEQAGFVARLRERVRPFGPINFFKTIWLMRPLTAIGMILLVAGPWYLLVGIQTGGAFHAEFFGIHHWQRFTTPMDNHSGPIFYYILAILIGLFPWSIYGGPATLEFVRQIRQRNCHFNALVFLACWVGVYVGIFSLASTKLPNYVLPAYPALALILGFFVDSAMKRASASDNKAARLAFSGMIGVGAVLAIGLPLVANVSFDGQTLLQKADLADSSGPLLTRLALTAVPLLVGGLLAFWFTNRDQLQSAFVSASVASLAFVMMFWNDAVPYADQHQTPQQIASCFDELSEAGSDAELAHFGLFRPSMVFYSGGKIEQCHDPEQVFQFLNRTDHHGYIVTTTEHFEKLGAKACGLEIVARRPDFPKQGELLLLRKPAKVNVAERPVENLR